MSLTQTRPDAPKVTGLPTLTLQLTRARLLAREGAGVLTAASVFAYVVCATLALTVAGGTWMLGTATVICLAATGYTHRYVDRRGVWR